ncbi:hypothetical protein A3770_02p11990 [Chloropicon primus]|uniref:Resolvase/invertase-type recombinase catalytic domain-containing protein n=1 Tax=Chloropicon primus TaxID=1764295 RepID=A0A5B8MEJ0_9CHLO|nr:hypothetical protein A3770_02p11990 [Chloropicon primus]|eukprot:QDZ18681.1 hypothetical protein A3770_02p11990 [Chloropicon primus]
MSYLLEYFGCWLPTKKRRLTNTGSSCEEGAGGATPAAVLQRAAVGAVALGTSLDTNACTVALAISAGPHREREMAAIEENVDPTTLLNADGLIASLRFADDELAGPRPTLAREGTRAERTREPEELTLVRVVRGRGGVHLERVEGLKELTHCIVFLRESLAQEGLGNRLAGQAATISSALLGKDLPKQVKAFRFVELGTASRSRCLKDRKVLTKALALAKEKGEPCALLVAALSRLSRRSQADEDLDYLAERAGQASILACIPTSHAAALIGEEKKEELKKYMSKAASTSDGHAVYSASHYVLKSGATRCSVASGQHTSEELCLLVEHVEHVLRHKLENLEKPGEQKHGKPLLLVGIARTSPGTDVAKSTSIYVQRCLLLHVLLKVRDNLQKDVALSGKLPVIEITIGTFAEKCGGSTSEEAAVQEWVKKVCDEGKYAGGVLLCTRADRLTRELATLGTLLERCCKANIATVACLTEVDAVVTEERHVQEAVAQVLAGDEEYLLGKRFVEQRASDLVRAWKNQPTVRVLVAACSITEANYDIILREEHMEFLETYRQYCHVHSVRDELFENRDGHGLDEDALSRVFEYFADALKGEHVDVVFENECFPETAISVTQKDFFECPCAGKCSRKSSRTTGTANTAPAHTRCLCACDMCKRSRPCILVDSDAEDGGERERELRKFDAAACPCGPCSSSPLSTGTTRKTQAKTNTKGKRKAKARKPMKEFPRLPTTDGTQTLRCICCDAFRRPECPLVKTGALTPVPGEERDRGGHKPNYLLSNWCWYCHRFIFKSGFNQWCSFGCFLKATKFVDKKELWDMSKEIGMTQLKNTIGFWFCVPCTKKPESEEALIEKIPSIPLIPTKGSRGLRCLSCSHNDCKIGKGYKENAEGGGVNVGSGRQKSENRKAKEVVIPHPMLVNMMLQDS